MASLSPETRNRIAILFSPSDREEVAKLLLEQCGNNLPFLESLDEFALDRFRFAALKLSDGRIAALRKAIKLANTDWRDLLVAAGFANDLEAHRYWQPEPR